MVTAAESPFIIRADKQRAYADARTIVAEAVSEAAAIRAQLSAERRAALEAARVEGLRQGLAAAAALTSNAAAAVERFWAEQEAELREVVIAVAYRVLSSLPAEETLIKLASEAINEYGHDVSLTLRTAPDAAACLHMALQECSGGNRVIVIADTALAEGECTLVHPRGRTEIGLLAQFRALVASLPEPR
jgi:flagellar biosynthesis/type III secretory pathway protein FliH